VQPGAAALLAGGSMDLWRAVFIGLAVFGLRTAGMSWNNVADYPIDRLNPRTQGRMLVSGKVSFREAYGVFALGAAAGGWRICRHAQWKASEKRQGGWSSLWKRARGIYTLAGLRREAEVKGERHVVEVKESSGLTTKTGTH